MLIEGMVNPPAQPRIPNGQRVNTLFSGRGEMFVSQLGGRYITDCYNGNVYAASLASASPAAIPAQGAALTATFGLWNRGPNMLLVPIRFSLGYQGGNGTDAVFGHGFVTGLTAVATGAAVTAMTTLTAQAQYLGGGAKATGVPFSSATIASGGSLARWSSISQQNPAATGGNILNLFEDFDGTLIVPPGSMWYPVASAASVDTFLMSVIWVEIPI